MKGDDIKSKQTEASPQESENKSRCLFNENEEMLRLLIKHSSDCLVIINADGRQRFVSLGAERITGYPIAELAGRTLDTLIHPDDMHGVMTAWKEAVEHPEKSVTVQYRHIHKTRGWVYSEAVAQSFLHEPAINGVIASVRDVTEHKRLEKALREKSEELERYFSTSLDLLCIANTNGQFVRMNPEWEKVLGYSMAELEGHSFLDFVHPEDRAATLQKISELENQQEVLNFENRYRRKDGTYCWIEWRSKPQGHLIYAAARDITERKNSEDTLRLRESSLSAIIENLPGLMWLKDTAGRFLSVNTEFSKSCGLNSPELLIGKTDIDIWPRELAEKYIEDDVKILNSKKPSVIEEPIFDKGEIRWFETFKTPVIDDRGMVIGTTGYARDITERKRAENLLRESEEKHRILLEESPDPVFSFTPEGRYRYANRAFAEGVGKAIEDIIDKSIWDVFPQDEADKRFAFLDQVFKTGEEKVIEVRVPRTDSDRYYLTTVSPVKDTAGKVATAICLSKDITERKLIEEQLRESEDKFRLTFNSSPDAVSISRLSDGLYVDISEGFIQTTGFSRDEIIGKSVLELNIWHDPAERQKLIQRLRVNGSIENLETQFRLKNGSLITGLISAKIISLKGVPHLLSVTRDITELKKFENEKLKIEKLESLGVLAGGIAHDFNNILTGIMGNISFAKIFLDAAHKSNKPLAEAEKAAVRAGELAHQLLTFARGGEPVKRVVSPKLLVGESLSFILRGSNVKGVVDIPDSIHAFEVDEGQMTQVLHNIIINATQAMPGGGILTVTAQNEVLGDQNALSLPPGAYVRLTFTDQGCGISADDLKRIFDPYFTTKSAGIGLGLSSVHSIVNRHDGQIEATSIIGKGTTFTIRLPSIGKVYTHSQAELAALPAGEHQGGSILVMDDDEMIKEIASSILSHLGYDVTTCSDGEEAIRLYKASMESGTPFLTVIMDLTIPGGLGGKEAAEKILSSFPNARLIVSSGYSNDPIMSNYREYGFSGVIAKPYNIHNFQEALGSVLA